MYLSGFLSGEAPVTEELMAGVIGEIASLEATNPVKKAAVKKLMANQRGVVSTHNLSAKAEFEKRLYLLPPHIIDGLQKGQLQISDRQIYTNKLIDVASTAELMVGADVSAQGLCNINARKLEPNQYFLVIAIQLQSAVNADPKAAAYGVPVQNILNGDFKLTIGNNVVIDRTSCRIFDTTGRTDVNKGYYKLENPKVIAPQTEIKPELWCPAANAANTCTSIVLHGAIIQKN